MATTWSLRPTSLFHVCPGLSAPPHGPRPLNSTGRHGHFLNSTSDISLSDMRQGLKNYSEMGHDLFLNSTFDIGINKGQRHATLAFLKIDMRPRPIQLTPPPPSPPCPDCSSCPAPPGRDAGGDAGGTLQCGWRRALTMYISCIFQVGPDHVYFMYISCIFRDAIQE